MAKIIGQVESLKTLRAELNKRNIYRFNSIGDINRFNKEFANEKRNVLKSYEELLLEEIKQTSDRIIENENKLDHINNENNKLSTNAIKHKKRKGFVSFIKRIIEYFKIKKLKKEIYKDSKKINYLSDNKQKVIHERSRPEINELEHEKNAIDELRPLIAGAVGESLVEKEIRKLPDDYTLINDYSLKFNPPIYNKKTSDRIYSIQIDHLLVSRSGLFILETKNWSKESINSLDLRSPVDQIIRTSFALFVITNSKNHLNKHHWGAKQIPIKSIIVMIHAKPKEEFKYVKIKLLRELNSYIEYFDPIISKEEVDSVVDSLVRKIN